MHVWERGQKVPVKEIFLSQCIDHGITLLSGTLLMFAAFAQIGFATLLSELPKNLFFCFLILLLFSFCGLALRLFAHVLVGTSLGGLFTGLRPLSDIREKRFWLAQIIEALHITIPALWAFDIFTQWRGSPISGLRYIVLKA